MKQFSNLSHYFFGLSVIHAIGNLTNWNEFDNYSKIIAVPLLSIIITAVLGFFIEWVQGIATKQQFDLTDIIRTVIGGLFGGLTAVLFPNLNLFMWISLGVTAILSAVELILLYKIYKQRK